MEQSLRHLKRYRVLIWGILCFAYIIGFLHRLALGTVKNDLMTAFHLSATAFANLGSAYFYAYLLMQVPAGILLDTLGAKKIVAGGSVLAGMGSVLFGFSPTATFAFISRLLVGVGASVIYIAILKILTEWFFEREFATFSGMTSFVGNMGGALAQTPLFLLAAFLSWRGTFILIGVLGMTAAVLCLVFVKDSPREIGLPSINELEGRKVKTDKPAIIPALLKICKNPGTWPPFFFFAAFYGSFQALAGTWGQSYLAKVYGMNGVTAANLMTFAVVGIALGSPAAGWLSDRLNRRKLPMLAVGALYLLSWGVLVFVNGGKPPAAWLAALLFALGFTAPAYITSWACGKEVNDPKYAGISVALINSGGFVGAAFIPLLLGKVIDLYGKALPYRQLYQKAFFVCFLCVLAGYVSGFFVKETKCKNVYGT